MLFLVGGSGITPVVSMLRTLDRRRRFGPGGPDVVLHYSSPTPERMIFRDELLRLADEHERFTLGRPLAFLGSRRDADRLAFRFPPCHVACAEALLASYAAVAEPVLGADVLPRGWAVVGGPWSRRRASSSSGRRPVTPTLVRCSSRTAPGLVNSPERCLVVCDHRRWR